MKDRFELAQRDFATRLAHWRDSLEATDRKVATRLFGIGVGRFPEDYFWRHVAESKVPTYGYHRDGDGTYLSFGGGALYINQPIRVTTFTKYRLAVDIRAHGEKHGDVSVHLCTKWLLYSRDCQSVTFKPAGSDGGWQHLEAQLQSGVIGGSTFWHSPVRLSVSNLATNTEIDIRKISLLDAEGRELLRNSDFSEGGDHWLFTVDDPLPWHTENIAVHILVEQGWLGLLCSITLLVLVIRRLVPAFQRGDSDSAALSAALVGALVVGQVDSFIEFPRLMMMFALVCAVGLARADRYQRLE